MDQRFQKLYRIRKQAEFDQVYKSDFFAANDVLVIRARGNDLAQTRLGLSISKRVGNAVVRNRWKRAIREAFRKQVRDLPAGLDIVVRPRKGAHCDYHAIFKSLGKLILRLDRKINQSDRALK